MCLSYLSLLGPSPNIDIFAEVAGKGESSGERKDEGKPHLQVQVNNFEIEDDVLDKLRLLKGFNDKLQQVSAQSAQQAKGLRDSLAQS